MGSEVIQDEHDALGVRIVPIDHLPDLVRPITLGPVLGDGDPPLALERLTGQEAVYHPTPFVLVIDADGLAGCGGQGNSRVAQQLLADVIQTDLQEARVVRTRGDIEHLLHSPDERPPRLRRDAPLPLQPRRAVVFFNTRRTVW